jgi:hypothetical protein
MPCEIVIRPSTLSVWLLCNHYSYIIIFIIIYNVRTMLDCGAFAELLCCHMKASVSSNFIVSGADVYSIRAFSIAMKMQQWIPFHFSPVLLLTIISTKYYDCVSLLLP